MHGPEDELLDGTQIAADWTFSGLQKFGQSYLDRLSGRRLPNRLLEKVIYAEKSTDFRFDLTEAKPLDIAKRRFDNLTGYCVELIKSSPVAC